MRIASYNIRKAVGLDWRRDPHRIVDVIGEIDADIVVLQEADKRLGQRPGVLPLDRLEAEQGFVLANLSTGAQSHGWHGNAILYRAAHVSMPRTERIPLPAREPRGAIAAHFQPQDFMVIGAHLALTSGIRKKQMQTLCAHAGHVGKPTIIAGDFNHWARTLPAGQNEVITPGVTRVRDVFWFFYEEIARLGVGAEPWFDIHTNVQHLDPETGKVISAGDA